MIAGRQSMAYKPLPYDARVEYLSSTGTQYIDTGITYRVPMRIYCDVSLDSFATTYATIYGASDVNPRLYSGFKEAGTCNLGMGGGTLTATYYQTIDLGEKLAFRVNHSASGRNFYLNNVSWKSATNQPVPEGTSIWAFGSRRGPADNENYLYYSLKGRLYSFTIDEGANTPKLIDWIPVRVGNVGYMYDLVSGQLLGNQGTGAFGVGPDFAFPQDYTPLQYVEFDGTQYIDLGFVFTPRDRIEANFQFTEITTRQQRVFCQRFPSGGSGLHVEMYLNGSGNIGYAYEKDNLTGWQSGSALNTNVSMYIVDGPGLQMYRTTNRLALDDLSSMTDEECGTGTMCFGRNPSADSRLGPRGRLRSLRVWRNGTSYIYLLPALDSNGVACMRDITTGNLYYSALEPLIAGPVKIG